MAFSLEATLGVDTSKMQRGLGKAKRSVSRAAKGMLTSLAPLAGFVGFSALANGAVNLGSKLSDLSDQLRINTTDLQSISLAAREAGVDQGTFERALRNVTQRSQEAIEGNTNYADSFKVLNINAKEFAALPTEKKLERIAKGLSDANESQAAFNAVANILGKTAGPQMIEVLRRINDEGLAELEKKARSAGLVMDEHLIQKMDGVSDKMEVLKLRMQVMVAPIIAKVIPAFTLLGNLFKFVGETAGAAAAVTVQYGSSLAKVVTAVVQPAITQFKALAKGVEGVAQALSGNRKAAQEAFAESGRLAKKVVDDFKKIPDEMKTARDDLARTVKSAFEVVEQAVDDSATSSKNAIDALIGKAKDGADEIDKALSGGGSGGGSGDGDGGGTGGGTGTRSKEREEVEKKARQLRLDALRAEVSGEKEITRILKNRLKLVERMAKIMSETDAGIKEAAAIAKKQVQAEAAGQGAEAADDKLRGNIRTGKIQSGRIGDRSGPSMEQRQREAGLFLAGNDPLAGRRKPENLSGGKSREKEDMKKALDPATKELQGMNKKLKTLEQVFTKS